MMRIVGGNVGRASTPKSRLEVFHLSTVLSRIGATRKDIFSLRLPAGPKMSDIMVGINQKVR